MNTKALHKTYPLTLRFLTPVHVGAGNEKTWMEHVDFFVEDGTVRVVRQDTLFRELMLADAPRGDKSALDEFSALLASGNKTKIQNLVDACELDLDACTIHRYEYKTKPGGEIRPLIRNGMGNPYLPGSSIKGAIRSAIFQYLYARAPKTETKFLDNDVLGDFDKSITRFIRPSDTPIPKTGLQNADLYNLYSNRGFGWQSDWKNGFKVALEVFAAEQPDVDTRLSISEGFMDWLGTLEQRENAYRLLHPNLRVVLPKTNPLQTLFNIINQSTREHLKREIAFFKKFPEAEGTGYIVESLEALKARTENNARSCILRMAYGSGYHGISGDWKFADHLETLDHPHQREFNKPGPAQPQRYKSRKLVGRDDVPEVLGFIELILPESEPDIVFIPALSAPKPKAAAPRENPIEKEPEPLTTPKTVASPPPVESALTNYNALMASARQSLWAEVTKIGKPYCEVRLLIEQYPFENKPINLIGIKGLTIQLGDKVPVLIHTLKNGEITSVRWNQSA